MAKVSLKLKELRSLPIRAWDKTTTYRSLLVIPTGKKHESGYAIMAIIGVDEKGVPIEIAADCDDICWKIYEATSYDFRTDMLYPQNAIHFWSAKYDFRVGSSLSSTDVFLTPRVDGNA